MRGAPNVLTATWRTALTPANEDVATIAAPPNHAARRPKCPDGPDGEQPGTTPKEDVALRLAAVGEARNAPKPRANGARRPKYPDGHDGEQPGMEPRRRGHFGLPPFVKRATRLSHGQMAHGASSPLPEIGQGGLDHRARQRGHFGPAAVREARNAPEPRANGARRHTSPSRQPGEPPRAEHRSTTWLCGTLSSHAASRPGPCRSPTPRTSRLGRSPLQMGAFSSRRTRSE